MFSSSNLKLPISGREILSPRHHKSFSFRKVVPVASVSLCMENSYQIRQLLLHLQNILQVFHPLQLCHQDNLSDQLSIRLHHNLHCIVLNQKSLSFQSKRKGASHISMTHTLLCIYSFLILFQKILRKAFFKHALIPWC